MHNFLLIPCGKAVEARGIRRRTTRVQASTARHTHPPYTTSLWVKQQLIPESFPTFPQHLSTHLNAHFNLLINWLSPVSTAPITRATKMKFKKG